MPGDPQLDITWNRQFVLLIVQVSKSQMKQHHTGTVYRICSQYTVYVHITHPAQHSSFRKEGKIWESMRTGNAAEPAFSWHLFLACAIQQIWLLSRSSNPDDNANSHPFSRNSALTALHALISTAHLDNELHPHLKMFWMEKALPFVHFKVPFASLAAPNMNVRNHSLSIFST